MAVYSQGGFRITHNEINRESEIKAMKNFQGTDSLRGSFVYSLIATAVFFALCCPVPVFAQAGVSEVEHVVIVGCDGLSSNGLQKANTPVLDRLMQEGAYSFHMRAVMPTSSSSNWASALMGAGPEQHGVTDNDWEADDFDFPPTVTGPGGMFPTIFSLIREQRPSAITGVFHEWDGFGRLFERKMVDQIVDGADAGATVKAAVRFIEEKKPLFTFIHLDLIDHAGHSSGYGSDEYLAVVEKTDSLVGQVVSSLKKAGIDERTLLLVISDHGGKEKGHGGNSLEEIEIPWIASGPGVAKGKEIKTPVNILDIAPTVAYVLGMKTPECWIGQPIKAAFQP